VHLGAVTNDDEHEALEASVEFACEQLEVLSVMRAAQAENFLQDGEQEEEEEPLFAHVIDIASNRCSTARDDSDAERGGASPLRQQQQRISDDLDDVVAKIESLVSSSIVPLKLFADAAAVEAAAAKKQRAREKAKTRQKLSRAPSLLNVTTGEDEDNPTHPLYSPASGSGTPLPGARYSRRGSYQGLSTPRLSSGKSPSGPDGRRRSDTHTPPLSAALRGDSDAMEFYKHKAALMEAT